MVTYGVTGATGELGQLVVRGLAKKTSPANVVALARNPTKSAEIFKDDGVKTEVFDYSSSPEELAKALKGVDRLLLIASNDIGHRIPQHQHVIDAAKLAGVSAILYTSVLHAKKDLLLVATEHLQTEDILAKSGVPYVLLRNGWYTENYLIGADAAIEHGALLGSGGDGRISSASRSDYADAAIAVLLDESLKGPIYELAGDDYFTEGDLAKTFTDITGKPVEYKYLPQKAYEEALVNAGVPAFFAEMLSKTSASLVENSLYDDSKTLSKLIGRPTTPYKETLQKALSK